MSKLTNHLPTQKQEELTKIAGLLSGYKNVEMVILFGSYATGKWVEDRYVEKGITYEYRSDYDLLVVLTHEDLKLKFRPSYFPFTEPSAEVDISCFLCSGKFKFAEYAYFKCRNISCLFDYAADTIFDHNPHQSCEGDQV